MALKCHDGWSRLVSNQRPSACEADALPLSYETWETHRSMIDGTSEINTDGRVAENPDDRPSASLRRYGHRHEAASWPHSPRPRRGATVRPRRPGLRNGICAASLGWTNVALRDGRRSRPWHADVAQLVAHHLAKVRVAGSNPVVRSKRSRPHLEGLHGGMAERRGNGLQSRAHGFDSRLHLQE